MKPEMEHVVALPKAYEVARGLSFGLRNDAKATFMLETISLTLKPMRSLVYGLHFLRDLESKAMYMMTELPRILRMEAGIGSSANKRSCTSLSRCEDSLSLILVVGLLVRSICFIALSYYPFVYRW
mmetsp:Transcript_18124/g.44841  ORF Transcript_18124/g.44841 Transcript_18124/m.44841 type:complete len:126 (+) Transcript_18124:1743-2120(+)